MPVSPGVINSQGTTIKKGTSAAIAFLTSIDGLDIKASTVDSTTLDSSGYKTFISGFKEVSEIQLSGHFDYTSHSGMLTDLQAGTSASYTIQFPPVQGGVTGASWNFTAIVTSFKTKSSVDAIVSFDATLKVSGPPNLVAGS